ncbi:MAG TPA: hypothetical protein VGZ52_04995 [Acidimicrobiales bacterium]|nr:hypothetical protein [Acidimicrobiales bacterium]
MTEAIEVEEQESASLPISTVTHPSGWWKSVDGVWHRPERAGS